LGRGLPKNRPLASGSQTGLHVVRIEHAVLTAGDLYKDIYVASYRVGSTIWSPRAWVGLLPHGLVLWRMSWFSDGLTSLRPGVVGLADKFVWSAL